MDPVAMGARLDACVATYCATWRNPALEPFTVHPVAGPTAWWGTPESARPGCYAAYGADGDLLYVGKASWRASVGGRLAYHDRREPRAGWRRLAAHVQLVTVSEAFEAPSLEEFLIRELRPRHNAIGAPARARGRHRPFPEAGRSGHPAGRAPSPAHPRATATAGPVAGS